MGNLNSRGSSQSTGFDRLFYMSTTGVPCLVAAALWIGVVVSVITGSFRAGPVLLAVVSTVAAVSGAHGWRSRNTVFGWAAVVLVLGTFALSKVVL